MQEHYRYTISVQENYYIVRRVVRNGQKYISDSNTRPVKVTNKELLIMDIPALFENCYE